MGKWYMSILVVGMMAVGTRASIGDLVDYSRTENRIDFECTDAQVRLSLCTDDLLRVQLSTDGFYRTDEDSTLITVRKFDWPAVAAQVEDKGEYVEIATSAVLVRATKEPFRIRMYRADNGEFIAGDDDNIGMYLDGVFSGVRRKEGSGAGGRFGFGIRKDAYKPLNQPAASLEWKSNTAVLAPFFMSTAGYGIYLNTIAEEDSCRYIEFDETGGFVTPGPLDYYFFYGPDFKSILGRYSELTGRMNLYPKWAYGYIIMKRLPVPQDMLMGITKRLREEKWPCDMIYLDYQWFGNHAKQGNLEWYDPRYPDVPTMFDTLHARNFKTGLITKKGPCPVENSQSAAQCWGDMIHDNVWAPDFGGESLLPDEFDTEGPIRCNIAAKVHWDAWRMKMTNQRPFIFNRGGWGSHHYSTIFTGDIGHHVENYKTSIVHMQNLGLIGYVYTAHDLGGYTPRNSGSDRMNPDGYFDMQMENATRWIASLGAFQSIMFTHGFMQRDPWAWDEFSQQTLRKFLKIRYRLLPYIYTTAWQGEFTGVPMVRAMALDYQDEPEAWKRDYQYMFGDWLLVAPALRWKDTDVEVWLPQGNWYGFFDNTHHTGGKTIAVHAEMDEIPVFVKEGAIIPMGPEQQYTDEKPLDPVILDIYPTTDESSYKLYEDDGATRNYLSEDAWCLTVYTLRRVGNDVNFQIHQAECGNESKFNVPESRRYYCTFRHIATAPEQITMNEGLLDRVDGLDALDQNDECFFYESESRTLHVRFIAASYEVSDVWFTGDWATKTRSQEPQRTTPAQIRKSKMSIKIEGSGASQHSCSMLQGGHSRSGKEKNTLT